MQTALYVRGLKLKDPLPRQGYLARLPVVRHLQQTGTLAFSSPVTFLVGENGAGKSTLLEAIAVNMGFNPEGGTVNFNFATANTHSELHRHLTVVKGSTMRRDGFFLRAESFTMWPPTSIRSAQSTIMAGDRFTVGPTAKAFWRW